uniref:Protein bicaudal C homolog 1 KH-like domain-containing protein n=1 Tax=Trichobilharzia regenti TaxID=157069 RepID=A0AA85J306_TRIRE|nr:unnamed protein product [Trichobilharzia regenti]
MLPITFTLEIPYLSDDRLRANQNSSFIHIIQLIFNVQIIFRNNFPLNNYKTLITVKGLAINSINTKNALNVIMDRYLSEDKDGLEVHMDMAMDSYNSSVLFKEISPEGLMQLVKKTTDAKICYITSSSSFPSSSLPHNSNSILRPPSPSISLNQQKYYQAL